MPYCELTTVKIKVRKGKNFAVDMDEIVNCPHCGREVTFGECYTSREIHTQSGFGYAVCEKCYGIERARENKWRNKQKR